MKEGEEFDQTLAFCAGGGGVGTLIRDGDWSKSPLGEPADWTQSLKTAVGLMLRAEAQIVLFWGPQYVALYNDAYAPTIGDKHPRALGRPAIENWTELWDDLEPLLAGVRNTGKTFVAKDRSFYIERHGYGEEVFFDVSYSAVPEPDGSVGGVLCIVSETTDRVLGERRVRESEARFRNMADHAPMMMWVTEPDGQCVYLNRAWYEFTGQKEGEALGLGWLDAVHPEDRGWSGELFLAANAKQEPFRLEYRLRRRDGAYRWAIDAASPRFGENGEFLGHIGSVIDIEDRREVEDALRASELRLRLATENAEVGFWDVDLVNDQLIWPARTKAMFGISPDAPVTLDDFYNGLHPDDRQATSEAFAAAADPALRALYDVEYRTIGKEDGVLRWVAAKGRGVFDEQGRCIRVAGTVIDITARKGTEARLADSETRYRTLFEAIDSGFCVVEVDLGDGTRLIDYRVVEANPAFYRQTGFPAEIMGKWLRGAAPGLEEHWFQVYGRVARTGKSERFEQGSGHLGRWFDVYAFSVGDPDECRVAILFNDISKRRNAEEGLRLLNETLESRVNERTEELEAAHEQLRQSQKMEAMGQLTGGVAHDFNNLLTPIVGSLDMLQRRGLGGEREQRLVAGALQSADRAKTLVQRLLAFARRQPLQSQAVDIAKLVTGMADLLASTTGPQIRVVVEAPDDLPLARADANQLEMALLNLGVNARDAMPDGGTLRISATAERIGNRHRSHLPPGQYVRLSVADTGVGMDRETAQRAVEPFFSTKGIGKGTGLGLSMVHGLASQLGGALTIDSRPGVGTNVELWLPRTTEDLRPALAEREQVPSGGGRGQVLLVDDEELVRTSTADMLVELGYSVVEAGSAEEAVRLIESGLDPDLLVTDHLMPGMNGTDLARTLRGMKPELSVLVVSGYAELDGISADLPRLTKPFRNADLASILAQLGRVEPVNG